MAPQGLWYRAVPLSLQQSQQIPGGGVVGGEGQDGLLFLTWHG